MTKVFLINPSMDVSSGFGEYDKLMEPMPCIGLAYLASSCQKAGHTVFVLDNFTENKTFKQIVESIKSFGADVVGISMLTPTANSTEALGRFIKAQLPSIKVIFGNLHASLFAKDLINNGACDAVVHGEGEIVFPRLIEAVVNKSDISKIQGITYKGEEGIVFTGMPEPINDLDSLPRPAWELFPWRDYSFLPFVTVAKPCLAIMGSRGCPFRCKFCALGYMGNLVRKRSPESIADEIEWLVKGFGARHIGFVDPIFPLDKKHAIATCRAIRAKNMSENWWWTCETRVDIVDEEMCREMKLARCKRILFGIESGVNDVLKGIGKQYNTDDVRRGVTAAKAAGLEISAFFMLGLPGETKEMTKQTIDFALSLDIDFAKFAITIPLPGSELYDDLVKQGKISEPKWEKFTTFNPNPDSLPYVPEGMTGEELLRLHRLANLKFYLRPRIIFRHLFVIRSIGIKMMFHGAMLILKQLLKEGK
jgi:radical SAM superfamily enzyme YgiQ (UPF0313 family)